MKALSFPLNVKPAHFPLQHECYSCPSFPQGSPSLDFPAIFALSWVEKATAAQSWLCDLERRGSISLSRPGRRQRDGAPLAWKRQDLGSGPNPTQLGFTQLCEFILFHLPGPQFSHLQTGEREGKNGKNQAWLLIVSSVPSSGVC